MKKGILFVTGGFRPELHGGSIQISHLILNISCLILKISYLTLAISYISIHMSIITIKKYNVS